MKQKLETEILPRIREKLKELRRRLEELGKEKNLNMLNKKLRRSLRSSKYGAAVVIISEIER